MDTRHIQKLMHSALAEYAPLSGILILAALMCSCVFLIANEVKRWSALVLPSAQPETIGEKVALSSSPAIPSSPASESSQFSTEDSVMVDRTDARNLALPERKGLNQLRKFRDDWQKRENRGSPQQIPTGYQVRQ